MTSDISSKREKKNWFIVNGYVHRVDVFFDGKVALNKDFPLNTFIDGPPWLPSYQENQYQLGIYEFRAKILSVMSEKKIIDIGCGNARKTLSFFEGAEITGIEIEPILSYLRENYQHCEWLESDFINTPGGFFPVLICSDVIEHIIDPDDLLDFIEKIDFQIGIISTPDRETLVNRPGREWDSEAGPPRNTTHLREWSFSEFSLYIGSRFEIIEHIHCDEVDYKSQLVCFRKRKHNLQE